VRQVCGIVGVASSRAMRDAALLPDMRDAMVHRGPDDGGLFVSGDGRCWLAMRRLAIVDLSHAGHQPMADPSGAVTLVLNGEIYNHRELRERLRLKGHHFRSHSDTEVLLAAYLQWGTDCLRHLNGMFAIAVHDRRSSTVMLARDRAGEKPLFYSNTGGRLTFASELKALLVDPSVSRTVDAGAMEHYLAYGYVPGDMCLLSGYRKLQQGEAAVFDLEAGEFKTWRYWNLPDPGGSEDQLEPNDIEAEVERLLRDSVALRLQADVPVGVLLSGGLDSSLITALAAQVSGQRVNTFTIAFPGHGTYDEGPHARTVADHFGTHHTELVAEDADLAIVHDLARQFDEPIADSSMIPTFLVSRLVRRQATVALGGDGGDELFGGYPHYSWLQQRERLSARLPRIVGTAADFAGGRLPVGLRGRNYVLGLGSRDPIASVNVYFDARWRRMLRPVRPAAVPPEAWKAALSPEADISARAMRIDFQSYLVDDILVKVDRASMLCSLEVRAPFLDHRLIELAFGQLPTELRATERERKVLLRRLARRLLPSDLDLERKQGFSLPLDAWLRGPQGEHVRAVLLDPASAFDRRAVEALLDSHARGRANAQRIYALWFLELWRTEYGVTMDPAYPSAA
jgi:asparagine synthase (glutamine-hydrolysing)